VYTEGITVENEGMKKNDVSLLQIVLHMK
jgi:hypothetical protein